MIYKATVIFFTGLFSVILFDSAMYPNGLESEKLCSRVLISNIRKDQESIFYDILEYPGQPGLI